MSDRQKARGVSLRVTLHETVNENRTFFFLNKGHVFIPYSVWLKRGRKNRGKQFLDSSVNGGWWKRSILTHARSHTFANQRNFYHHYHHAPSKIFLWEAFTIKDNWGIIMLYVYLGLRLMSLKIPLVVLIAANKTGEEGAVGTTERNKHKWGFMGKEIETSKYTENIMQQAEA